MGAKKILTYRHNRYQGSLTDAECDVLNALLGASCVSDIRHIIYCLADSDVDDIIRSMEKYGVMPMGIEKPYGSLLDYQTIGVAYMFWAKRMILGDSVGMGKTVQCAGFCRQLELAYASQTPEGQVARKPKILYLTGKNLIDQSRKELIKFTGEYVELVTGDAKPCQKYINNHPDGAEYSLVAPHSLFNQKIFFAWLMEQKQRDKRFPFDAIIVDESSVLGSPSSGITKNAKEWFKYCERVLFLNATPFELKLDVFVTQLSLLDNKLLPTKENLVARYYEMNYNGFYKTPTGKYKNGEELKRLVGFRYLARTRKSEGAKMIDCHAEIVTSPLSPKQKKLMKLVTNWRMVCDCPNYFNTNFNSAEEIDFNEENVPKLMSLIHVLEKIDNKSESILIYAPYKETLFSLSLWFKEMGYAVDILYGDTKDGERTTIIERFKNGSITVLLTNVQKGLNFGSCNYCIFFSFDPNPQKMVQFEGRITREFDIIGKNIFLLASEGKELGYIENKVGNRAKFSKEFTEVDSSCVMELLTGGI